MREFTRYLINVGTVNTISQHSKRAFSALETFLCGWIIKTRYSRKTRLEATEVLNFNKEYNRRDVKKVKYDWKC